MLRDREKIQELMSQDQFELIARVFKSYVKIRSQGFEIENLISKIDNMKSTVSTTRYRQGEAEKEFKRLESGIFRIVDKIQTIIDVKFPGQNGQPINSYSDPNQFSSIEVPEECRILEMIRADLENLGKDIPF